MRKFHVPGLTSQFQTFIREGLNNGAEEGVIKSFDFPYAANAGVNVSLTPHVQDNTLFYDILIIDTFECDEGHFHVAHLAEMVLGRCQGFKHDHFDNYVAHLCADVVSTFFKDSGYGQS